MNATPEYPADTPFRHALRILASGIAFTLFAIGGSLATLLIPLVVLLPGGRPRRQARARGLIRWCFGRFVGVLNTLRLVDTHVQNRERIPTDRPVVVVANHPSLVDVVALYALLPNTVCVIKEGVWKNPFMALPVRSAGFVPNFTPQDLIDQCVQNLLYDRSIMIFPEGTRSHPDGLRDFRRGAAHMALASGVDLLPVVITMKPLVLAKGWRWYHMADRCCHHVLSVEEPIPVADWQAGDAPESVKVRKLTAHLEKYFADRLKSFYKAD